MDVEGEQPKFFSVHTHDTYIISMSNQNCNSKALFLILFLLGLQ